MNPVNATTLYIAASRLVLNYDSGDPQASAEICKMLPFFRQALACCVCGEPWGDFRTVGCSFIHTYVMA